MTCKVCNGSGLEIRKCYGYTPSVFLEESIECTQCKGDGLTAEGKIAKAVDAAWEKSK